MVWSKTCWRKFQKIKFSSQNLYEKEKLICKSKKSCTFPLEKKTFTQNLWEKKLDSESFSIKSYYVVPCKTKIQMLISGKLLLHHMSHSLYPSHINSGTVYIRTVSSYCPVSDFLN